MIRFTQNLQIDVEESESGFVLEHSVQT